MNIDTEETFNWSAPFCRHNVRVGALSHLHKGHEIFRRYGLRPTYLVDYPVVDDPSARDVFGRWIQDGECSIGAHLHPWVNPPYEEVVCLLNTFPCNLPADLERAKLQTLTNKIAEVLGTQPQVYRAGRYGVDPGREAMLYELGYLVDTSILPYRNYEGTGGGPNFFGYPDVPFWSTDRGQVLFLPVTQSLVGCLKSLVNNGVGQAVFSRIGSRLRAPGLLARLHLLERIMFTPEGVTAPEMRRLLTSMTEAGHRVFSLSMHSPTFMPGGTPYARNDRELEALLHRIEAALEFFFGKLGGVAAAPIEIRATLAGRASNRRPAAALSA